MFEGAKTQTGKMCLRCGAGERTDRNVLGTGSQISLSDPFFIEIAMFTSLFTSILARLRKVR